ncbi:hypothetical protein S2M10_29760 [Sphingomonas sp. S2M10]|nr:hypothetical protein [Sphingomonas sp. S2M10]
MTALKPCPFCGGEGEIAFFTMMASPNLPAGYFIECATCACSGPRFHIESKMPDRIEYTQRKAIEAWNTRAEEDVLGNSIHGSAAAAARCIPDGRAAPE